MTERDKAAEGFLERWLRRKIDAEQPAPAAPEADAARSDAVPSDQPERPTEKAAIPAAATAKTEFDPASLPLLESITAGTDIRGFLMPNVPKDLARAALRRAWTTDPAIRDFKGLAENDWDFTDPAAMPGFGELPPGTDIKKLLAQIFGDGDRTAEQPTALDRPAAMQPTPIDQEIVPPPSPVEASPTTATEPEPAAPHAPTAALQVEQTGLVQRNNNIASHNSIHDDPPQERKMARSHGRALPQ